MSSMLRVFACCSLLCSGSAVMAQNTLNMGQIRLMNAAVDQAKLVENFSVAAKKKDLDALADMVAPSTKNEVGAANLKNYLETVVLPFFSDFDKLGNYTSISNAVFSNGTKGVWHYKYAVDLAGNRKPFAVALINEGGADYVATITVNKCVRDRHQSCD